VKRSWFLVTWRVVAHKTEIIEQNSINLMFDFVFTEHFMHSLQSFTKCLFTFLQLTDPTLAELNMMKSLPEMQQHLVQLTIDLNNLWNADMEILPSPLLKPIPKFECQTSLLYSAGFYFIYSTRFSPVFKGGNWVILWETRFSVFVRDSHLQMFQRSFLSNIM